MLIDDSLLRGAVSRPSSTFGGKASGERSAISQSSSPQKGTLRRRSSDSPVAVRGYEVREPRYRTTRPTELVLPVPVIDKLSKHSPETLSPAGTSPISSLSSSPRGLDTPGNRTNLSSKHSSPRDSISPTSETEIKQECQTLSDAPQKLVNITISLGEGSSIDLSLPTGSKIKINVPGGGAQCSPREAVAIESCTENGDETYYQVVDKPLSHSGTQQGIRVNFVVRGFVTSLGQDLYVVGNIPELGCWNPYDCMPLVWTEHDTWSGTLVLDEKMVGKDIEYKYIMIDNGCVMWEDGSNKCRTLPGSDCETAYLDEWIYPAQAIRDNEANPTFHD